MKQSEKQKMNVLKSLNDILKDLKLF
jgi:hypothetical protein